MTHEKLSAKSKRDLLKLASRMDEVHRNHYDQKAWTSGEIPTTHGWWKEPNTCGTACCIGGHAAILFPQRLMVLPAPRSNDALRSNDVLRSKRNLALWGAWAFADAFEIPCEDACEIVGGYPRDKNDNPIWPTPKRAARMLRRYVKTGIVRW